MTTIIGTAVFVFLLLCSVVILLCSIFLVYMDPRSRRDMLLVCVVGLVFLGFSVSGLVEQCQAEPMPPEPPAQVELPPPGTSCQRWVYTRMADCEAVTGSFARCLWWIYSGADPKEHGVEPDPRDGKGGYQGHWPPPTPKEQRP